MKKNVDVYRLFPAVVGSGYFETFCDNLRLFLGYVGIFNQELFMKENSTNLLYN